MKNYQFLKKIILVIGCGLMFSTVLFGQTENLEIRAKLRTAQQMISARNFTDAEAIYDDLLEKYPNNTEVLLARGTVRSYQKKYAAAQTDFQSILRSDSNNISALVGLGYNFAWSGAYAQAETQFQKALSIAPSQIDARKGLAYSALWSDNAETAVKRFESLANDYPNNAEIKVGLGQSLAKANREKDAKRAFRGALEIEPNREDAKQGLSETKPSSGSYKPRVDFTLLGGFTSTKNETVVERENSTGVRFAEIAVEPTRNTRVWFQYDNGLSLDNFALARSNRNVPTYFVGGLVNYKRNYLSKFAFGWRNLPNNVKQKLYDVEQVFFLPKGYAYDIGVIVGPRSDNRTETIFHTGVNIPVKERLRIHPTFFYAQSGLPGEKQMRGLLAGEYAFQNGVNLNAGFAAGRDLRPTPLGNRAITDVFGKVSFPLGKYIHPQFTIRREAIGNSSNTIFAFGFTLSNKEVR